jgi:DNA-binding MarR family transcriptional regulator
MTDHYVNVIRLIDKLHRQLMVLFQVELTKRLDAGDLTPVQAMILFNIGNDELPIRELSERGHYLGSNVSYNLKRLKALGYMQDRPSEHDRRSILVRATDKGRAFAERMREAFDRHVEELRGGYAADDALASLVSDLERLSAFWNAMARPPSVRREIWP